MKRCHFCAEEIQDAAIVCKHCGRDLAPTLAATTPASPPPRASGRVRAAVVGFGLVAIFIAFIVLTDGETGSGSNAQKQVEAFLICQEFVKQRLRAPATAQFPSWGEEGVTATPEDALVTVRAWVDAQNGFGALLRMPFTCETTKLPTGRWQLDKLDLQDSSGR